MCSPRTRLLLLSLLTGICSLPALASAQPYIPPRQAAPLQVAPQTSREEQTVADASATLKAIMSVPAQSIPRHLLKDAYGIAIVPGVVKGSFVVGVRHGRGVVMIRDTEGNWQAPIFVSLTGGSVGWQLGLQSTDVILVFKSPQSVNGLMNGKLTIGVDAAASAGPVGRNAAAATDGRLQAEILSYSRSRGLFAGVSIDGSSIQVDRNAGASYYRQFQVGPGGNMERTQGVVPPSAVQLVTQLTTYTGGAVPTGNNAPSSVPGAAVPAAGSSEPRVDLGQASTLPEGGVAVNPQPAYANASPSAAAASLGRSHKQLMSIVDQQWQQYLALPQGNAFTPTAAEQLLTRYNSIAADARYQALTSRAEFVETHRHLREYVALQAKQSGVIKLPPPPGE